MPFHTRPQASIYYETYGDQNQGPWVTLINGHTRSSRDFKFVVKALADTGFRCLTFDNRGSGQTRYEGALRWQDLLEDGPSLWDKLDINETHLAGISMGGMISQVLAAQYGERILRLALISTAPSVKHLLSFRFLPWGDSLESVQARLSQYLTPQFLAKNGPLVAAMARQTLEAIKSGDFVAQADAQHRAIQNLDNTELLSQIKAPTLIIHGRDDAVIRYEAAEYLRDRIPSAQLKIVEGCGHLLLAEYTRSLTEDLLQWFKKGA